MVLGIITMKGYSALPRFSEHEPQQEMKFSVLCRTPPLGVYYSPVGNTVSLFIAPTIGMLKISKEQIKRKTEKKRWNANTKEMWCLKRKTYRSTMKNIWASGLKKKKKKKKKNTKRSAFRVENVQQKGWRTNGTKQEWMGRVSVGIIWKTQTSWCHNFRRFRLKN